MIPNPRQVQGFDSSHISFTNEFNIPLHRELLNPLRTLQQAAADAGFTLQVASGHRSFERQLTIWNLKAQGYRPLWDHAGQKVLPFPQLSPTEIVFAILRWSALPGASRHHWGTDIDVFDAKALPPQTPLQLIPQEVEEGGIFYAFHCWLDEYLQQNPGLFFRPYTEEFTVGVAPEKWHLSYIPLARKYEKILTHALFEQNLQEAPLIFQEIVLAHALTIYETYIYPYYSP